MPSSSSSPDPSIPTDLFRPKAERSVEDDQGPVTLIGTVEQGVESRSIVLIDGAGAPLAQLGGHRDLTYPFGARVRVTGRFTPGLRTTAQQGRPFRVETLTIL